MDDALTRARAGLRADGTVTGVVAVMLDQLIGLVNATTFALAHHFDDHALRAATHDGWPTPPLHGGSSAPPPAYLPLPCITRCVLLPRFHATRHNTHVTPACG